MDATFALTRRSLRSARPGPRVVDVDVVVVGAGRAGLGAARHLRHAGLAAVGDDGWDEAESTFVVLDEADRAGGSWRDRWPGLPLAATDQERNLPGLPLDETDLTRPARDALPSYFARYEDEYALHVLRPVRVDQVDPDGDRLAVRARMVDRPEDEVVWRARGLVNATGSWSRPFWPFHPGQDAFTGRQLHQCDVRDVDDLADGHVIVVGAGPGVVHLLAGLAQVTTVTWVTRERPPVTDADLTPAVRGAAEHGVLTPRPMFDRIGRHGVWFGPDPVAEGWTDGPAHVAARTIVWATGFRPALAHLAPLHLGLGAGDAVIGPEVLADPRVQMVGSCAPRPDAARSRVAVRNLRRHLGL
ncbi:MAG: NAD(P)-binding domain-containing protein [Cellulomonas sp.]|nr:NAD(P)-binding domain-containing protein [Cellulomonas sp.]